MADERSNKANSAWPVPAFSYRVQWGAETMSFQEVFGLDVGAQPMEYRHGEGPEFSAIQRPGIAKVGTVTLKKGVHNPNSSTWDWSEPIKMDTIEREAVTITLLDESGTPTMVWTLANAWLTKVGGIVVKSDGSEIAIDSIEFAHEGLTIETL